MKIRTGFGRWSEVLGATCRQCNKQTRLIKSWHGARPPGAILCTCGAQLNFAQFGAIRK